ncbi:MAG TPA: hypothetical protein VFG69_04600, partial [Nannocystaceae bacterium]|nr:hypothetical protein [Nannocystaceae bacterium]
MRTLRLVVLGCLLAPLPWTDGHDLAPARVVAQELSDLGFDEPPVEPLALAVIPERGPAPTAAELLEQRLAALASAVESRRR